MKAGSDHSSAAPLGVAGRIARAFIDSKLTPLIIIASVLLGVFAVLLLPREEEPQIKVPMVDVLVTMPGAGAKEVEERVTRPMEKLLWEIPGVEYIYSTSSEGQSLVIVRFKVGEDMESSLVKLNQKLQSNYDKIPHGVSQPLIKAWSIDDVPILALTFHSARYDHLTLRRLVAQVDDAVKQVPQVAGTTIIGGARREVRVLLDPAKLASRNLSPVGLIPMLQQANRQYVAGGLTSNNKEVVVETGGFLASAEDVGNVVVGVFGGKPVYLRDVATIVDGAEEPTQYVFFGDAVRRTRRHWPNEQPAVTLTIAKRPGANAITVANEVLRKIDTLKGRIIPADVQVTVTRNYGVTAEEKSNELLWHMLIAVVGVSLLILLALGWRESLIVAIAIPVHARADAAGVLSLRLHAEPHHAVRADFHHRHPGGRRHCGGRKHRPPFSSARKQRPEMERHRRRSRQRSRQPDHSRHVRGDCRRAADGVCRRVDGALHAADSHWLQRGDVFLAGHRVHRHAVGEHPDFALGPEIFLPDRRRGLRDRSGKPAVAFRPGGKFFHADLLPPDGAAGHSRRVGVTFFSAVSSCCCWLRWRWSASAW